MLKRIYYKFLVLVSMPMFLEGYFSPKTGREYNIGLLNKISLLWKIFKLRKKIPTLTGFMEQLVIVTAIMAIPRNSEGCVVECGCYKGGSTAALSLACKLCGRELHVFDSFEGLPAEPEQKLHDIGWGSKFEWQEGDLRGELAEVENNIRNWGDISACRFYKGNVKDTLPQFREKSVLVFLDVDLVSSFHICLRYLWPLLQDGCPLFAHEAQVLEIAEVFFDRDWWKENLQCSAPGLVGSGCGLGLFPLGGIYRSFTGFTFKNPDKERFFKINEEFTLEFWGRVR